MKFKKIWLLIFTFVILGTYHTGLLPAYEVLGSENDAIYYEQILLDDYQYSLSEGLISLISFAKLTQGVLIKESSRLKKELGENHPRVEKLTASIEANQNFIQDLEVELEIASIEIPEAPPGGVLVHGRVSDAFGRGFPTLLVYGENESSENLTAFGKSETDNTGYFSIPLDKRALEKLTGEKVFLVVKNLYNKTILFRDEFPLELESEMYILRNIVIR